MSDQTSKEPAKYLTESGIEIKNFYTNEDWISAEDASNPGEYPYTRGIYQGGYRDNTWQVRQYCGFGLPEDTNERAHYIVDQGGKDRLGIPVLNLLTDVPTQIGLDSDDPRSKYEVGRVGAAIDNIEDMEVMLKGFDLDRIFFNFPSCNNGAIQWALYLALARKWGVPESKLAGSTINAPLEGATCMKTPILSFKGQFRVAIDLIEYGARRIPKLSPVVLGESNFREAGANAVKGVAFALAEGVAYAETTQNRGVSVNDFAPRFSFYMNTGRDLFEEIAKYRATRRIWAHLMKDRFHATNPRATVARITCRTNGSMLTAQQPLNNVVRTTIEALASLLGGVQSVTITPYDEVLTIPTKEATALALRTHEILMSETGIRSTVDPFGGSYFMEHLTKEFEEKVLEELRIIEKMAPEDADPSTRMTAAIINGVANGYFQNEIDKCAYERKKAIDAGRMAVVGVNRSVEASERNFEIVKIDQKVRETKIQRLKEFKLRRSASQVDAALEALKKTAQSSDNMIEAMIEAFLANATIGEVVKTLQGVLGLPDRRGPMGGRRYAG